MTNETFKLPGSSYDELVKIIQAYGYFSEPANNADIGKAAVVHDTIVSKNNGFLLAVGIIEGGQKKGLTEQGRHLARALEHEMPPEIRQSWRALIRENDFLQKLLSAVRIRKGMDRSTLQAHVAYTAGQPKKPAVLTGAGAVVDILKAAELIVEDGDKFVSADDVSSLLRPTADSFVYHHVPGPSQVSGDSSPNSKGPVQIHGPTAPSGVAVNLNVEIRVHCNSADDVASLGKAIRALLDDLASGDTDPGDE